MLGQLSFSKLPKQRSCFIKFVCCGALCAVVQFSFGRSLGALFLTGIRVRSVPLTEYLRCTQANTVTSVTGSNLGFGRFSNDCLEKKM